MIKSKNEIRNPKSETGFTLVELLVVISIISLLVAILFPALSKARKLAANLRTSARITELSNGCIMYRDANDYYPGQEHSDQLIGNDGDYTGSQWLARSLFTDPSASPVYPNPKYAAVKISSDLIEPMSTDGYHTIADRYKTHKGALPILYYPASPGNNGAVTSAFVYDNNIDYVDGDTRPGGNDAEYTDEECETEFQKWVADPRFGKRDGLPTPGGDNDWPNKWDDDDFDVSEWNAYNSDSFLLIGAGIDRQYFTGDDVRNW